MEKDNGNHEEILKELKRLAAEYVAFASTENEDIINNSSDMKGAIGSAIGVLTIRLFSHMAELFGISNVDVMGILTNIYAKEMIQVAASYGMPTQIIKTAHKKVILDSVSHGLDLWIESVEERTKDEGLDSLQEFLRKIFPNSNIKTTIIRSEDKN